MSARIIIVTGPPGAGKTTLARRMAQTSTASRTVHLHTDDFYDAIKKGYVPPWLTDARAQNETISHAIAASARAYAANGYEVILDGIVGPWFLDIYKDEFRRAGLPLHYVVLRPREAIAVTRARDRTDNPLPDYPPNIYAGLSDLSALEPHVIDTSEASADEALRVVTEGLAANRFRLGA